MGSDIQIFILSFLQFNLYTIRLIKSTIKEKLIFNLTGFTIYLIYLISIFMV
jgi:hypothetical protein